MSESEYPTDEELDNIIKNYVVRNVAEYHVFMAGIRILWRYADCGYWTQEGDIYRISTGGWSGNEDLVSAMQSNYIFWAMYWYSSKRGGHYVFCPHCVDITTVEAPRPVQDKMTLE